MLPESLKLHLEKEARQKRLSFGELVRRALQKYLLGQQNLGNTDPFLSSQTLFLDDGPPDVSASHDDYLIQSDVHGRNENSK